MPQFTNLTKDEVQAIFDCYEVAEPLQSVEVRDRLLISPQQDYLGFLPGGLANTNVKLTTSNKRYLMKICNEKSADELEVQLSILSSLKEHNYKTAYPYKLKAPSATITSANAKVFVWTDGKLRTLLFNFLDGTVGTRDATTEAIARELGASLASLSLIPPPAKFLHEKPPYPPGFVAIDPFLEEIKGTPHRSAPFVEKYLVDMLKSTRETVQDATLPHGLVHGDVFPDNCMYSAHSLVAIFDFEEVSYSPLVLDVVLTIAGCFYRTDGTLDEGKTEAFLEAYEAVRPLTRKEQQVLDKFMTFALISLAFWRFRQFNVRRTTDHLKDYYKEFTVLIDQDGFGKFYASRWADVVASRHRTSRGLSSRPLSFFSPNFWNLDTTYRSTRGITQGLTFEQALLSGYADDGGIFLPDVLPTMPLNTLKRWSKLSYPQMVANVLAIFVPEVEIPFDRLQTLIDEAFKSFIDPQILPVVPVGDSGNLFVLEMFHGLTGAFKDLALSIMGKLLEYFLQKSGKNITILVGTSGDTGSAAIYAVKGSPSINIIVLYPHGRISTIQERQMCTVPEGNVRVFAVDGTSDDLDEPIKRVLNDADYVKQHSLCSINSINWCRVCIQIAHFFFGYFQIAKAKNLPLGTKIDFSIPTGACGDLVSAWLAHRLGLPSRTILAAVNENDILHRLMETGKFSVNANVIQSIAPSMDIQVPYNVERLFFYASNEDSKKVTEIMERFYAEKNVGIQADWLANLRAVLSTASIGQEKIKETITHYSTKHNYLLDPHSAIGVAAVEKSLGTHPVLCCATATPFKFTEAMESILGKPLPKPENAARFWKLTDNKDNFAQFLPRDQNWETHIRSTVESMSKRFTK